MSHLHPRNARILKETEEEKNVKRDIHPKWPEPPQSLKERLLHVLDIFKDEPEDMVVITATTNTYAPHGEKHSWTGLTLSDLRVLADVVIGDNYTLSEHAEGCDFAYTGAKGEKKCLKCDLPLKDYKGKDCPKVAGA